MNGGCLLEKALFQFKTVQSGTSRVELHTNSHNISAGTVRFRRQLPAAARTRVARATALAVCLEMKPLRFCYGYVGMRNFAQTIFEIGQTVPASEKSTPIHIYLVVTPLNLLSGA